MNGGQVRARRVARGAGADCGPAMRHGEASRHRVLVSGVLIQNQSTASTRLPTEQQAV